MAYDAVILSALDAQRQVEQFMPPGSGSSDFQWSSGFDPASFIFAVSSRIPTVEEGSLGDGLSPPFPDPNSSGAVASTGSGTGTGTGTMREMASPKTEARNGKGHEEKTVKIIWWRPHGHTAIAPGTCRPLSFRTVSCLDAWMSVHWLTETRAETNHAESPGRSLRREAPSNDTQRRRQPRHTRRSGRIRRDAKRVHHETPTRSLHHALRMSVPVLG